MMGPTHGPMAISIVRKALWIHGCLTWPHHPDYHGGSSLLPGNQIGNRTATQHQRRASKAAHEEAERNEHGHVCREGGRDAAKDEQRVAAMVERQTPVHFRKWRDDYAWLESSGVAQDGNADPLAPRRIQAHRQTP